MLTLGSLIDVRLSLNVAGGQEIVEVSGDAPVVDPQKTVVSSVISQEQIEHLPINGRNFIGFSLLAPGVATDRTPQQGASGTSGLTFAGQRARSNNITVDGLDNNDATVGSVRATFSQEAVREFQVLTNSYSAEFGKASGGVVNIVTKSGTNTIGGNAVLLLPRRRAECEGSLRAVRSGRPGDRPRRRRRTARSSSAARSAGRSSGTGRSISSSFERLDIAAQQLRHHRRHEQRRPCLGRNYGTPAQILGRAGFPVETGQCAVSTIRSNQFLAKSIISCSPNQR